MIVFALHQQDKTSSTEDRQRSARLRNTAVIELEGI